MKRGHIVLPLALLLWASSALAQPGQGPISGGGGGGGGGEATSIQGSATLPATCTEKDVYQDTNSGGTELYVCTATNTWTKAGTGDVVGPASSTDSCLAIFDSTTGKLLECHSSLTVDGTNNLFLPGGGIWNGADFNAGVYASADNRLALYIGASNMAWGLKKNGTGDYRFGSDSGSQFCWVPSGNAYDTENCNVGLGYGGVGIAKLTNGSTGGGALDIGDPGTRPTCDSSKRGVFWVDEGGAGVADAVSVCAKDAGDAYAWHDLY